MQLNPEVPSHGAFAYLCIVLEHLVSGYPFVVADRHTCAVYETNACTPAKTKQLKEQHHLYAHTGLQFHKAIVRELMREQILEVFTHIKKVIMFKIAKLIKVEAHENGHDLGTVHGTGTVAMLAPIRSLQAHFCDFIIIFFAKIIDNTENM